MFVAKLPGSTYATAAMNAGPRNGHATSEAATPSGEGLLGSFEDARLAGEDVVERMDESLAVVRAGGGRRRSHRRTLVPVLSPLLDKSNSESECNLIEREWKPNPEV